MDDALIVVRLRALAGRIEDVAARERQRAVRLDAIAGTARWHGRAAAAFRDASGEVTGALRAAVVHLDRAAAALRRDAEVIDRHG